MKTCMFTYKTCMFSCTFSATVACLQLATRPAQAHLRTWFSATSSLFCLSSSPNWATLPFTTSAKWKSCFWLLSLRSSSWEGGGGGRGEGRGGEERGGEGRGMGSGLIVVSD